MLKMYEMLKEFFLSRYSELGGKDCSNSQGSTQHSRVGAGCHEIFVRISQSVSGLS